MRAGYRLLAQRLGFVPEDMEKDREVVPGRHHDGDHVPVWVHDRKRRDEAGDARRLTVIDLADRGIAKAELGGLRLKGRRLVELHRADLLGVVEIRSRRHAQGVAVQDRSEESRVGKGCVSTCRSRWSAAT